MNNCQIAWGANYEPTLAMISQSFGKFRFIACHSYLTFFISLSQPKELLIIYFFFFDDETLFVVLGLIWYSKFQQKSQKSIQEDYYQKLISLL